MAVFAGMCAIAPAGLPLYVVLVASARNAAIIGSIVGTIAFL